MKEGYTDITVILDRSGSMASIASDTVGGFNTLIEDRKEDQGETKVSLVQFDNEYETVFTALAPSEIEPLKFTPRGGTALHDAIGRTILDVGNRLSDMDEWERPDKVLFVILTDGEENSSLEFNADKIKEMITHQQDIYSWDFIFIGANQDAILTAQSFGICQTHAMNFCESSLGTKRCYDSLSSIVSGYASSGSLDCSAANAEQEDLIKSG